jgi:hypothetical protein
MKVNGITLQIPNVLQNRSRQTQQESDTIKTQPDAVKMPEAIPTELDDSQSSEARGVIRNLLDGHYKGVADVRLRINHYEQLEALESQQLKIAVDPQVGALLAAIQNSVSQIPELNESLQMEPADGQTESAETATVSGLYAGFNDTVSGLVEQFKSGNITQTNTLIDGIKNAFADFVASLQNLLVPQTQENPPIETLSISDTPVEEESGQAGLTDEILETETQESIPPELPNDLSDSAPIEETQPPVIEPLLTDTLVTTEDLELPTGPDYPTLINQLEDVFSAQINDLTSALTGPQLLPALSEPSGNGAAYNKFLAIYNDLWSVQPSDNAGLDILNI